MTVTRRHTLGLLAALPALPALAASDDPSARLRALLDASAAADAALDPTGDAGVPRPAGSPAFVDPGSDAYEATLRANKQREWATLQTIDRARLDAVDAIAWDVLAWQTRQTRNFLQSGLFAVARQAPLNPSFGLHIEFPDFVAGSAAPFTTVADYDTGLQRLDEFAGALDNTIVRLREGRAAGIVQPRIIVENVLKQVDALLAQPVAATAFYAAVTRMPAGFGSTDRTRLTTAYRHMIETRVLPAYRRWQAYLRDDYLPIALSDPGRWAMKHGDALYAAELARHTTTDMSADAIHTLGVTEVTRIRAEMEAVRGRLGFSGDLKALFDHVRTDPVFYCKTEAELLDRFRAIEARIWQGIPRLFRDRPKAPFEVQPLPGPGAARGTGYYRAGPGDGKTPGVLFFNMAMLPTRPIPTLETLTLHEGIPGHHFQLTLARENAALPPLLRTGSNTAFAEGWGLYAESLGPELGMFTDPWQWFGHLDMEMLRAVRLVVDTGLHARRWSRDRAIAFMADNTSMAPHDIAVEIDRYIAQPGQACAYKIGELTLQRLRKRAAAKLGPGFDIRDFHAQVLDTGALPLAVLTAKIDGWLAG
ncbi:DUF885 domain-containing protein [Polymorphobacter fuscus]|uniref:DUF885 family protein n=1 Tax=Sandarakinorhabdus fusca TaxID=1439888 RepID=A0A7C9GPL3_9SPHN|nr:DUF885 domain-containing protein [Polymorphobacter fuscus]KAB7648263.1 DUF885 domain-containing protein [Polymorphobacter fuscus]MQT15771.1 DUF885 family protein [Polymorphobacter fuscus]NJC07957.1 uncharacterized protein (DUF885 family) [Polymorphobacter fuscus]